MRRRQLLTLVAGAAALGPRFAFAQQSGPKTIGVLGLTSAEPNAANIAAFEQGLKEAGWTGGENATIDYRWAESHEDRLAKLAGELVARKLDIIATSGGAAPAAAANSATTPIPIGFA